MYEYYTPILLLQAFCLYHAYKRNTMQRWFWIIVFFSIIGCLIYLYDQVYSNRGVVNLAEGIKEGVKGAVNSNYKIEQLEKELRFSDNVVNKTKLAAAYIAVGRFKDAIALYQACLVGFMADDPALRMKLLYAYFLDGNYEEVIALGKELESEKTFKGAEERIAYAWALHKSGDTKTAEINFENMDAPFSNYVHRLEYCKFLVETNRVEEAKSKLLGMLDEYEHMKGTEKSLKRDIMREIKAFYRSITG